MQPEPENKEEIIEPEVIFQPGAEKKIIPYPIIWDIQLHSGEHILEYDNNAKEIVFSAELLNRSSEFRYISLVNILTKQFYAIDLITGEINICGGKIKVAKEVDGRTLSLCGLPGVDYAKGILQYKESYPIPLIPGNLGKPIIAEPRNFNIGYKVNVPENICRFCKNGGIYTLKNLKVILTVDAVDYSVRIADSHTWEVVKDGMVSMVKI
jgi:hypothetical protein